MATIFRNAIEHGGPTVTVRVGPLPDGDGFYVEDDGPGFPAIDDGNVFDTADTTSDDGTGFGLSIVREIATAHGWEVTATGGSDGGARLEFTGVERPGDEP
ncbi:sensor histidine kinase [Haloarcula marina]|uniref:sensor histidine kinase n=1 Tax=Haloarcula marina TaxID=2961574 RepID=UPI0020B8A36B|nr:HAMP domain-containing sensor histidine kinase [Halomicroarcula marina]